MKVRLPLDATKNRVCNFKAVTLGGRILWSSRCCKTMELGKRH